MTFHSQRNPFAITLLALGLTACGGTGGGDSLSKPTPTKPPPPKPPPSTIDNERAQSLGVHLMNAEAVNICGFTCKGATIGQYEDSFTSPHSEISGKLVPSPYDDAAYFPAHFPELRSHVIAAAALDKDGVIASFSNRCGDSDYNYSTDSSFAAPSIAAALAILKQAFPSIGNDKIVERLYITTNKTGIYAVAVIYGQGRVGLDAAARPNGLLSVPTGTTAQGSSFSVSGTTAPLFSALGYAVQTAFQDIQVMALDSLSTPFYSDLDWFVVYSEPSPTSYRLNSLIHHVDFSDDPSTVPLSQQWLILAGPAGSDWQLSLNYGTLTETTELLGSEFSGAFGEPESVSLMAGLTCARDFRNWQLTVSGMASLTASELSDGLTEIVSPLIASSFELAAQRRTNSGTWRLALTQPMGEMQVHYPSGIDSHEVIHYQSQEAELAPSGRQLDLEASCQHQISKYMSVGLGLWLTRDFGHTQDANAASDVLAALQTKF